MNASVGTQTIFQDALYNNQFINDQLVSLQAQASTGQKFANVSDDPTAAMSVIADNDQNQALTTHLSNIQSATAALNTSASALQDVNNIFAQAKSIAIEAGNSANDTSTFGAMAQQVNGLINSLLTAANTQNNGVYVFGGASYNTQPYTVTSQDGQGDPTAISYQASNADTSTIVDNSQSVPVYYAGSNVFQDNNAQAAVFSGNTGAQPGSGTDSATGQQTLTITHTSTTYAPGSGVAAGTSSASGDTILGPPGSHTLQITDTSGNGSAGTVSLDGGPAVAFSNGDTNLQVANSSGDVVYLDTSAITHGFNGTVAITANGSMSIDGGASSTPITYAANQAVTDGATGAVTFVDTTNLQRTGTETVAHPGTYDAFQVLIALRDDLNNVNNLSSTAQIQAISSRIADLDNVSTHIETTLGAQSTTLQGLGSLQSNLQNLQLSTQENISNVGGANMTDVVVQLQTYEQMLQMSLLAFSKISSTSLLNYLQ
jgi:flagellar hook-associated protein 3 FlgL